MGYEEEFVRYLQTIMTDVDRRIRRGHARLIPREKVSCLSVMENIHLSAWTGHMPLSSEIVDCLPKANYNINIKLTDYS